VVSAADAQQLRSAQQGIGRLVRRDLSAFWATLDLNRPEAARDALVSFVPELTSTYGESAASVAADWYDEQRAAAGVRGRYRAQPAAVAEATRVQRRVRFGAQHLFTLDPSQTLTFLLSAAPTYALAPGRDTIRNDSLRDPRSAGWKRVTRPGACAFCQMLAGRGGVYKEETAHFASHDDCNCAAVPSWDPNAEEVDVDQYVASARMEGLRQAAARGNEDAQHQLDEHRAGIRAFMQPYE